MATAKVNFTPEHKAELDALLLNSLYEDVRIKGVIGTELNTYELLHATSVTTLSELIANKKREEEKIGKMDEFTLTDYQIAKQKSLQAQIRMLTLLIGYKRWNLQKAEEAKEIAALKKSYKDLKEDLKTPEDRIKEMEAKLAAAGVSMAEV